MKGRTPIPLADRFDDKWTPEPFSGCWLWTAATDKGYGRIDRDRAHRVSWRLRKGPIPDGLHVLHSCDTKLCVNPSHLFLGTHLDNVSDCTTKGRMAYGERNGASKLSEEDIRNIRSLYPGLSQYRLAAMFHVHQAVIWRIVNRLTWKRVASEKKSSGEKETDVSAGLASKQKERRDSFVIEREIRNAIAAFAPADENIHERTTMDALNVLFQRIANGRWPSDDTPSVGAGGNSNAPMASSETLASSPAAPAPVATEEVTDAKGLG